MIELQCYKCGHREPHADDAPADPCPRCGYPIRRLLGVDHDAGTELDRLRAENERLRELLRRVEWAAPDEYGYLCCPVCEMHDDHGHAPDCDLAKEIGGRDD